MNTDGSASAEADLRARRPAPIDRARLRAHLIDHAIAGNVATPRENNIAKMRSCLGGGDDPTFGIISSRRWEFDDLLKLMSVKTGISADGSYTAGPDRIDPDRTIERLEAMRAHLRAAARERAAVLLATGHPGHLLGMHLALAQGLRRAGCRVLTAPVGDVRVVGEVHVLGDIGNLVHTHSPKPMRSVLRELGSVGHWPDLVVADHGWAGAAAMQGITTVGFADCNDPGLFIGEEDGTVAVAVPLDDGIEPHLYAPVVSFLLDGIG